MKIQHLKIAKVVWLGFVLIGVLACGNSTGQNQTQEEEKAPKQPITEAAFFGNLEAMKEHIAHGTDLNKKDAYGSTPLTIAITFGKTDVAKALIDAGADIHLTSQDGSTPLHTAAFLCRTDVVKHLLAKGANINVKNNFGSTALESVEPPFKDVKTIYDELSRNLGPFGLKLDYSYIEATRPVVAELIKDHQ